MYGYLLTFDSLPKVGFALHCKISKYNRMFTPEQEGIEVLYVKKGTVYFEYHGSKWTAPPGSLLILQRDLPFKLYTKNNETSEHSTVQLLTDFIITVTPDLDTDSTYHQDALALPFILYPSSANEEIMRKMNSIISDVGDYSSNNNINRNIILVSVLYDISQVWKSQRKTNVKSPSILCYKIKKLISENIEKDVSLDFLSEKIGKTPNYLNYIFKEETGMTIHNYIMKEKVRIICELILSRIQPFKDACSAVGITDVAYGYRVFKKHTGLTPKEFLKSQTYEKYKARNFQFI